jgi:hypothetical protein
VIVRKLKTVVLGAYLGASLAAHAPAQDVMPAAPRTLPLAGMGFDAPGANQRLANAVATRLKESGVLRHYQIDLACQEGVVEMNGQVADVIQHAEVLRLVRGVPGVNDIRDRLREATASMLLPAQAAAPQTTPPPPLPAAPTLPPNTAPFIGPPPTTTGPQEPTPIFQAPPGPNPNLQPPPLPPNAWPTFAPYNNYSRVAYPTMYPYEAWPFIGPFYPFPRVPLGWRSVTLTWQDGHWWYGKNATGHDWWRVRYW